MRDLNEILEERCITDYESVTIFNCFDENLTSLKGIEEFKNLKSLCLRDNIINSIEEIKYLNKLEYLDISCNYISSLKPLKNLINLKTLSCYINKINTLEGIENCKNLELLDCDSNMITSIKPLKDLKVLKMIELYCEIIPDTDRVYNITNNNIVDLELIKDFKSIVNLNIDENNYDPQYLYNIFKDLNIIVNNEDKYTFLQKLKKLILKKFINQ